MKMPPTEQIDIAVMWLESNEGQGIEGEACKAVAKWIEHLNTEAFIRHEARCQGISIKAFRRLLEKDH